MNIESLKKYVDLDTVFIVISLAILIIALIQFSNIPEYQESLVKVDMTNDSSPLNYGVTSCSLTIPDGAKYSQRENFIQILDEPYNLKIEFTNKGNEIFKLVKDDIGFADIYEYNSTHIMINIQDYYDEKEGLNENYVFILSKDSLDTNLTNSEFVETNFNLKEDNIPMCIIKGKDNDFVLHVAHNLKIEE